MHAKVRAVLNQLGVKEISPIYNKETQRLLRATYGRKRADELTEIIESRAEKSFTGGGSRFYDLKNAVLDGSLLLSASFEYDYYVNLLSVLIEKQDVIGESVLDIGCDCGILSCAIALLFPNTKVVGIDRCNKAITCAEELAKRNSIKNVSFEKADIMSFNHASFYTILSSKLIHEAARLYTITDPKKADLSGLALIYKDKMLPVTKRVFELCAEGGVLVSVERLDVHPNALGYFMALCECGFAISAKSIACIRNDSTSTESGDTEKYPICLAKKEVVDADRDSLRIAYDALFEMCKSRGFDFTKPEYFGWKAFVVFESRRGEFIYGYDLMKKNEPFGEITVWKHNYDPTCIIILQIIGNTARCAFTDVSYLQEAIASYDNDIETVCKTYGVKAVKR